MKGFVALIGGVLLFRRVLLKVAIDTPGEFSLLKPFENSSARSKMRDTLGVNVTADREEERAEFVLIDGDLAYTASENTMDCCNFRSTLGDDRLTLSTNLAEFSILVVLISFVIKSVRSKKNSSISENAPFSPPRPATSRT